MDFREKKSLASESPVIYVPQNLSHPACKLAQFKSLSAQSLDYRKAYIAKLIVRVDCSGSILSLICHKDSNPCMATRDGTVAIDPRIPR